MTKIQTLQITVHLRNGVSLEGDIQTRMVDETFTHVIDLFKQIGNLSHLRLTRNGRQLFINPKEINYVEVVTT